MNAYYPSLTAKKANAGFGKIKNQYPMDKNLSFFPSMSQGNYKFEL